MTFSLYPFVYGKSIRRDSFKLITYIECRMYYILWSICIYCICMYSVHCTHTVYELNMRISVFPARFPVSVEMLKYYVSFFFVIEIFANCVFSSTVSNTVIVVIIITPLSSKVEQKRYISYMFFFFVQFFFSIKNTNVNVKKK